MMQFSSPNRSSTPLVFQLKAALFVGLWVATLSLGAGCTLDFNQFESRGDQTPDVVEDTGIDDVADGGDTAVLDTRDAADGGDSGTDGGDVADTDTGPTDTDTADGGDTADTGGMDADGGQPMDLQVGASCETDMDCGSDAVCMNDYCTRDCQSDDDCPAGSACSEIDGEQRCLLTCGKNGECPEVDGRTDLGCATASTELNRGTRPTYGFACLPDQDTDHIRDSADNCPMRANIRQQDVDGDGEGDVCDSKPSCHPAANSGVLDYGSISFPHDELGYPNTVRGPWLPVAGGLDDTNAAVDKTVRLDRINGQWETGHPLPSPTAHLNPTPIPGSNAWLALPGATSRDDRQIGRMIVFNQDGTSQFDGGFGLAVENPQVAATGMGRLLVLGFVDDNGQTKRRVWRYKPQDNEWTIIHSENVPEIKDWEVVSNRQGGVYFYDRTQPGATPPVEGTILEVDALGEAVTKYTFSYPTLSSAPMRGYDPMIIPGPGDRRLYAFDRKRGEAVYLSLETNSTTRASNIDLNIPFDIEAAAVNPEAPSLVLFGRKPGTPDKLHAREYFIACSQDFDSLDTDGDTIPDITDNCPTLSNAPTTGPQADADDDGIGNPCDDDADNDGIPDNDDFDTPGGSPRRLSLDSDDDGEGNATDSDDDGDGIRDERDRYPLDTDNDGVPNLYDPDDDNDGYSDDAERKAGASRVDPLEFPDAGVVAFVRERASDGSRVVRVGSFSDLSQASTLLDDSAPAYSPRLFDSGRGVVALNDEPGMAKGIRWRSATTGQMAKTRNLNVALEAIDPLSTAQDGSLDQLVVIKKATPMGMTWDLVSRTLGDSSFQEIVGFLPRFTDVDVDAGQITFVGGHGMCPRCMSVYTVPVGGGSTDLIFAPDEEPVSVRRKGPSTVVITRGPNGTTESLYHLDSGGSATELPAAPFERIDSAVPLNFDGHLVVSAKKPGDSYNLWFYNGLKDRWHRLHDDQEDLVEIDWIR